MQPRPVSLGHRKVLSRVHLVPERVPSPINADRGSDGAPRARSQQTGAVWLWDRLVLAAFWISFAVFMHALLGVGPSDPARTYGTAPRNVSGACAEARTGPGGQASARDRLICAGTHGTEPAERYRREDSPGLARATAHTRTAIETQPRFWARDDVRYDDPELEHKPFFEPHEYDEDGQPFAMRIHLKDEDSAAKGAGAARGRWTRKCRPEMKC